MNLRKLILTNNACFKAGKTIIPKGIMVHSTGANNPWLKRYIGPDDGLLGKNQYNNHWNQDKPGGRQVCVHAFIGKLADGTIATYQTLPWNHRGWHAGGTANNTYIGFEICEDGLSDSTYFNKVYREAVELCVYLCKLYGLTEENILCHSEGYKLGIASNHADVMHWFSKHRKNMDMFRAEVKALLSTPASDDPTPYTVYTVVKGDSLWAIAKKYLGDGSRYKEIVTLNGLKSNVIIIGQKLKIPK
jgi:N-acetylmuramoyl-L-alanine amidase